MSVRKSAIAQRGKRDVRRREDGGTGPDAPNQQLTVVVGDRRYSLQAVRKVIVDLLAQDGAPLRLPPWGAEERRRLLRQALSDLDGHPARLSNEMQAQLSELWQPARKAQTRRRAARPPQPDAAPARSGKVADRTPQPSRKPQQTQQEVEYTFGMECRSTAWVVLTLGRAITLFRKTDRADAAADCRRWRNQVRRDADDGIRTEFSPRIRRLLQEMSDQEAGHAREPLPPRQTVPHSSPAPRPEDSKAAGHASADMETASPAPPPPTPLLMPRVRTTPPVLAPGSVSTATPSAGPASAGGDDQRNSGADYNAFFRVEEEDTWLEDVELLIGDWIRERKSGWDLPIAVGGTWENGSRWARARHLVHEDSLALDFEMREDGDLGRWTTRVIAVQHQDLGGWISVKVTNDEGRFVAVPGLAELFIGNLALIDGNFQLHDGVWNVDREKVPDLRDLLFDPDRRHPVFITGLDAAHEATRGDTWRRWFKEIVGIGHAVALEPEALQAFNALMPAHGDAKPRTIRTYLPGLREDDATEWARHRFLGTERLDGMRPTAVAGLLGRVARDQANRREHHAEVQEWERRFARQARLDILTVPPPTPAIGTIRVDGADDEPGLTTQPPIFPTEQDLDALTDLLRDREGETVTALDEREQPTTDTDWSDLATLRLTPAIEAFLELVGADDLTVDVADLMATEALRADQLKSRLDAARTAAEEDDYESQILRLERAQAELEMRYDDLSLELHIQGDRENELVEEVRRLQGLLIAAGRVDEAFDPSVGADNLPTPQDYDGLLEAIDQLASHGVVFSGDAGATLELTRLDPAGRCVPKAWQACLVLSDYVRAKASGDFSQGVAQYLEATPNGYRTLPAGNHAPTETGITQRQFGEERIFPVPPEVREEEWVQMLAHFKLGRVARHDPRLYYLDDTQDGGTGRVYIGYLGRHLTNTQT